MNKNNMAGGAVVWLVFVIAIMGESWILENNTMETVIKSVDYPAVGVRA